MISKDLFDLDILYCVVSYEFDKLTEFVTFISVLQKVLKRQATSYLLDQVETKAVIKGFLIKVGKTLATPCAKYAGE